MEDTHFFLLLLPTNFNLMLYHIWKTSSMTSSIYHGRQIFISLNLRVYWAIFKIISPMGMLYLIDHTNPLLFHVSVSVSVSVSPLTCPDKNGTSWKSLGIFMSSVLRSAFSYWAISTSTIFTFPFNKDWSTLLKLLFCV